MVAREPPERERQRRVAAGVVQRVARLVEKRLVVVEPALRPGDQVDEPGWVGRDHACTRRLLRPVLEVGADPLLGLQVEAHRAERREADGHAALLRVRRLERGEPPDPRHVGRGRHLVAIVPEEAVEPTPPRRIERLGSLDPGGVDRVGDRSQRHLLVRLVTGDRVFDPRDGCLELVPCREERAAFVVEAGRDLDDRGAEGVAAAVVLLGGEPRLRAAERQGVAVPGHARGEKGVLQLVLALGELAVDEPLLTLEPEPGHGLALGVARFVLRLPERVELPAGEQILVARDDGRLLGGLLLPHAHRPRLLGALDPVLLEPALEVADGERAHAATSAPCPSRARARSRPRSSSDS